MVGHIFDLHRVLGAEDGADDKLVERGHFAVGEPHLRIHLASVLRVREVLGERPRVLRVEAGQAEELAVGAKAGEERDQEMFAPDICVPALKERFGEKE